MEPGINRLSFTDWVLPLDVCGKPVDLDVESAFHAIGEVDREFADPDGNGKFEPSLEYKVAMRDKLIALGLPSHTPSVAMKVRESVLAEWDRKKKLTSGSPTSSSSTE